MGSGRSVWPVIFNFRVKGLGPKLLGLRYLSSWPDLL